MGNQQMTPSNQSATSFEDPNIWYDSISEFKEQEIETERPENILIVYSILDEVIDSILERKENKSIEPVYPNLTINSTENKILDDKISKWNPFSSNLDSGQVSESNVDSKFESYSVNDVPATSSLSYDPFKEDEIQNKRSNPSKSHKVVEDPLIVELKPKQNQPSLLDPTNLTKSGTSKSNSQISETIDNPNIGTLPEIEKTKNRGENTKIMKKQVDNGNTLEMKEQLSILNVENVATGSRTKHIEQIEKTPLTTAITAIGAGKYISSEDKSNLEESKVNLVCDVKDMPSTEEKRSIFEFASEESVKVTEDGCDINKEKDLSDRDRGESTNNKEETEGKGSASEQNPTEEDFDGSKKYLIDITEEKDQKVNDIHDVEKGKNGTTNESIEISLNVDGVHCTSGEEENSVSSSNEKSLTPDDGDHHRNETYFECLQIVKNPNTEITSENSGNLLKGKVKSEPSNEICPMVSSDKNTEESPPTSEISSPTEDMNIYKDNVHELNEVIQQFRQKETNRNSKKDFSHKLKKSEHYNLKKNQTNSNQEGNQQLKNVRESMNFTMDNRELTRKNNKTTLENESHIKNEKDSVKITEKTTEIVNEVKNEKDTGRITEKTITENKVKNEKLSGKIMEKENLNEVKNKKDTERTINKVITTNVNKVKDKDSGIITQKPIPETVNEVKNKKDTGIIIEKTIAENINEVNNVIDRDKIIEEAITENVNEVKNKKDICRIIENAIAQNSSEVKNGISSEKIMEKATTENISEMTNEKDTEVMEKVIFEDINEVKNEKDIVQTIEKPISDDVNEAKKNSENKIKNIAQKDSLSDQDKLIYKDCNTNLEWMEEKKQLCLHIGNLNQVQNIKRFIVQELMALMSCWLEERRKENGELKDSRYKLIKERDQALEDLRSVENAFTDLHRRYEKTKNIIEEYKQNEDRLKQQINEAEEKLKQQQQMFEFLRKRSEEKLDEANAEIMNLRKSKETDIAVLKAQLRKSEMKAHGLEKTLEQKVRENAELSSICEELIAKVGKK